MIPIKLRTIDYYLSGIYNSLDLVMTKMEDKAVDNNFLHYTKFVSWTGQVIILG